MKKKSFDQTPNLTENFDQLKMSIEIRSTDPLSISFTTLIVLLTKASIHLSKQEKSNKIGYKGRRKCTRGKCNGM